MAEDFVRNVVASREIKPRSFALEIPEGTPRHWLGGDPYMTHLLNAFSLMFPQGERFFMDSVRAFRDQLTDERLKRDVRGFLSQEALHSREHHVLNGFLTKLGFDAEGIDRAVGDDLARRRAARRPIDDLAVTCALEHFTALLAELWLARPELRELAVEPLRTLWTWHAIEELEHKAVAFDVYRNVGGSYKTRVYWMARTTVAFILGISLCHVHLMRADGELKGVRYLARRWWKFWGVRGLFTQLVPHYLRYYGRDFHPSEQDHTALIDRFERELAQYLEPAGRGRAAE
jgi:predicted metal-dependent hydrolase